VVNQNGTAKRLRKVIPSSSSVTSLPQTVVCSKCGQRFAIESSLAVGDAALAEKQAAWVADQLVWDHIQERKHHGTMELPNLQ
jgi:hypothetical protein